MSDEPSILLFDGVCNLCNGWVQFVIRRDPPPARFRFAALQSEAARRLLGRAGAAEESALDSIVLLHGGEVFVRSTAVLKVMRGLGLPWSILAVLLLVPRPIRDGCYRWVARNRYRWFGRRESCMLPTPELRSRFLE